MPLIKPYLQFVAITAVTSLITSCMVGPDFHSPKAPATASYNEKPLPAKTVKIKAGKKVNADVAQVYQWNRDLPSDWWALFHSKEINQLVERGLANSPTITSAEALLRQAQENVNAQIGLSLYPNVTAGLGGQRQKFSAVSIGGASASIFDLYNASVNVTYTLDVWGGARRQIEALRAQVDNQRYQLVAAYLTLTSNIVTSAITLASLQAQIDATEALIKAEQGQLDILRKQFNVGGVPFTNVMTQQTLVDQTRATLPPLQKSLSQARHQLSVYVGAYPNEPLPIVNLNALVLPKNIPISLPSHLVRQRPDVQQSEALLHAASAQVGVATANLLPQISLTGAYGWQALSPAQLFKPLTNVWSYAGQLTQPVFNGGALRAQRRAAIDAYQASYAQYQQVVLQAFQNVADSLRAIETDARAFRDQKTAEMSAARALKITKDQFKDGGVSYANLLNAQQQYQQVVIARVQAQALRYSDTVALYQSLGGGWWNCHLERASNGKRYKT